MGKFQEAFDDLKARLKRMERAAAGQTSDYTKLESEIYRQKVKLNSLVTITHDANAKLESRVDDIEAKIEGPVQASRNLGTRLSSGSNKTQGHNPIESIVSKLQKVKLSIKSLMKPSTPDTPRASRNTAEVQAAIDADVNGWKG